MTTWMAQRRIEPWHGTPNGYTNRKCRKACCRAAHSKAQWERRQRRYAERVWVDGHWEHPNAPHGTSNGYTNYGCRCFPCGDGHNKYQGRQRG